MYSVKDIIVSLAQIRQTLVAKGTFSVFHFIILKKTLLDDSICRLFMYLPDAYQELYSRNAESKYISINNLKYINQVLKKNFILNSDYYIIDVTKFAQAMDYIENSMLKDLKKIVLENH